MHCYFLSMWHYEFLFFCIRSFIKTGMVWMDIKSFTCSTSQELKHRFVHLTVSLHIFHSFRSINWDALLSCLLCLLELGHRASAGTGEHWSVCSCAAGGGGEERGRTVSHQLHGSFTYSCECCQTVHHAACVTAWLKFLLLCVCREWWSSLFLCCLPNWSVIPSSSGSPSTSLKQVTRHI